MSRSSPACMSRSTSSSLAAKLATTSISKSSMAALGFSTVLVLKAKSMPEPRSNRPQSHGHGFPKTPCRSRNSNRSTGAALCSGPARTAGIARRREDHRLPAAVGVARVRIAPINPRHGRQERRWAVVGYHIRLVVDSFRRPPLDPHAGPDQQPWAFPGPKTFKMPAYPFSAWQADDRQRPCRFARKSMGPGRRHQHPIL